MTDDAPELMPAEPTPSDPDPPPTLFPCQFCTTASFPSSARLGRHIRKHHLLQHEAEEERLRAEFAAKQEARAVERRVQDVAPGERRPEERSPDVAPAEMIARTTIEHLARLTDDGL